MTTLALAAAAASRALAQRAYEAECLVHERRCCDACDASRAAFLARNPMHALDAERARMGPHELAPELDF